MSSQRRREGARKVALYVIVPRTLRLRVKKQPASQVSITKYMRERWAGLQTDPGQVHTKRPRYKLEDVAIDLEAEDLPRPGPADEQPALACAAVKAEEHKFAMKQEHDEFNQPAATCIQGMEDVVAAPTTYKQAAICKEEVSSKTGTQICEAPSSVAQGSDVELEHDVVAAPTTYTQAAACQEKGSSKTGTKISEAPSSAAQGSDVEPDSEPDTQACPSGAALTPQAWHTEPLCMETQPDSEPDVENSLKRCSLAVQTDAGSTVKIACSSPRVLGTAMSDLRAICDAPGLSSGLVESIHFIIRQLDAQEDISTLQTAQAQSLASFLEELEEHLGRVSQVAKAAACAGSPDKVLQRARKVGGVVGLALGRASSQGAARTLRQELDEFAAHVGNCRASSSSSSARPPVEASVAAAALWADFGGVENYAAYLHNEELVPDADKALCRGMSWQRLLSEVNVAVMLTRTATASRGARSSRSGSGRFSRTSTMGLDCDSLLSGASEPLRLRLCYVAARVEWFLLQQADDVLACMCDLRESEVAEAPELASCQEGLEACPVIRELLHLGFRDAAATAAEKLFSTLECTLAAGCKSPELLLRPQTTSEGSSEVSLGSNQRPGSWQPRPRSPFPSAWLLASVCESPELLLRPQTTSEGFSKVSSRHRVIFEMARRAGSGQEDTNIEAEGALQRAEKSLKEQLALEVLLFSQAAFVEFSGKNLEAEVRAMGLTRRQREAVWEKQLALRRTAFSAQHAHAACRRLVRQLQANTVPGGVMSRALERHSFLV